MANPIPATGVDVLEARALAGDIDALGTLMRSFDDALRAAAWSVVRSATATDDVVQITYEKVLRNIAGFDGRSSLKTWMHAICFRTALDHVRREGRHGAERLDLVDTELAGVGSVEAAASARVRLAAMLADLDPETRGLLMLIVGLGYSYDEVAEMTGFARGTLASRISRARQTLREGGR